MVEGRKERNSTSCPLTSTASPSIYIYASKNLNVGTAQLCESKCHCLHANLGTLVLACIGTVLTRCEFTLFHYTLVLNFKLVGKLDYEYPLHMQNLESCQHHLFLGVCVGRWGGTRERTHLFTQSQQATLPCYTAFRNWPADPKLPAKHCRLSPEKPIKKYYCLAPPKQINGIHWVCNGRHSNW